MRHVTAADLDRLEPLLAQLRSMGTLRERNRGTFTRKSRAFLHFHADGDELFADIRFADEFERHRVTTAEERDRLLRAIERAVEPPARGGG
jgi:aerobic-type carbon monoxide dehydrogenase small subunit (CoxS/CutS family)